MFKRINPVLIICFLCYGFTGATVIVTGVVLGDLAKYFGLPAAEMGMIFTWLNSGILLATTANIFLLKKTGAKKQFIFMGVLLLLALWLLFADHDLTRFSFGMLLLGVSSGITMSVGTSLIANMYEGRMRASRLLLTDSFFSMAGTLFPMLAGYILVRNQPWQWIYAAIIAMGVVIILLSLVANFAAAVKKPAVAAASTTGVTRGEKWGPGVYLISTAAFAYILGQLGLMAWIPQSVMERFNVTIADAGATVGHFWTAYMVGMWCFSVILKYLRPIVVLIPQTALSSLLIYLSITSDNFEVANYALIAAGFISSGIYTTLITLGTLQVRSASPSLVNFILTCGTVGTMLTFVVTGPMVGSIGVEKTLWFLNGLYAYVFVISALTTLLKSKTPAVQGSSIGH